MVGVALRLFWVVLWLNAVFGNCVAGSQGWFLLGVCGVCLWLYYSVLVCCSVAVWFVVGCRADWLACVVC